MLPLPARELQVRGSTEMRFRRYPERSRMVESGMIKPQSLLSEQVPLVEPSLLLEAMSDCDTIGYSVDRSRLDAKKGRRWGRYFCVRFMGMR